MCIHTGVSRVGRLLFPEVVVQEEEDKTKKGALAFPMEEMEGSIIIAFAVVVIDLASTNTYAPPLAESCIRTPTTIKSPFF